MINYKVYFRYEYKVETAYMSADSLEELTSKVESLYENSKLVSAIELSRHFSIPPKGEK